MTHKFLSVTEDGRFEYSGTWWCDALTLQSRPSKIGRRFWRELIDIHAACCAWIYMVQFDQVLVPITGPVSIALVKYAGFALLSDVIKIRIAFYGYRLSFSEDDRRLLRELQASIKENVSS